MKLSAGAGNSTVLLQLLVPYSIIQETEILLEVFV